MSNNWGNTLTPSGTGQGNSFGDMFGNAMNVAADTGMDKQIAGAAMGMVAGPLGNEDQLGRFYHLLATHPNEVSTFFLHHLNEKNQPVFIVELLNAFTLIVKKELYEFFSSEMSTTNFINKEKALELGYAAITQENIDVVIANMVPLQQIAMEVERADNQAMNIVKQAKFQAMSFEDQQNHQQQQIQQEQMWRMQQQQNQQMLPPKRPSLFGNILKLGTVVGAGALGGQGAQQVATNLMIEEPNQYNQSMYGSQQGYTGQQGQPQMQQQGVQQAYNVGTGQPY